MQLLQNITSSLAMISMETSLVFFKINSFILIGGQLLYNIVVVFAVHGHESATGSHSILSLPYIQAFVPAAGCFPPWGKPEGLSSLPSDVASSSESMKLTGKVEGRLHAVSFLFLLFSKRLSSFLPSSFHFILFHGLYKSLLSHQWSPHHLYTEGLLVRASWA